ncbi:ATP synthase F1 subunit delta [[Mycoplasma] phocae]|uniref:ATP synthase subunit delta n=1 Tax=[Mycoplasma] phocae TaxID=142651 RepID=A0A2Z5ISC1_9BACT|nr:F0F1 ATP synthase subunit delta [[Mycoplasma] phocae]AXE60578.1 ATP synthase F1 subunit delta [[Mycoplasma] phocae]
MTNLNELIYNWSFALFDLARSSDNLPEIANQAAEIVKVVKKNKSYLSFLNSYDISDEEKFKLIDKAFGQYHEYLINIIKLASKQHTIKYLIEILNKFVELANEKLNIKYGTIFTVKPLTDAEIRKFEIKISKKLNSDVHLMNEVTPEIIGGIKIKVDDFLIDNSVLGQLNKIKKQIN